MATFFTNNYIFDIPEVFPGLMGLILCRTSLIKIFGSHSKDVSVHLSRIYL